MKIGGSTMGRKGGKVFAWGGCVEVVESQLTRGEEVATDESAAVSRSGKAWGISTQARAKQQGDESVIIRPHLTSELYFYLIFII